MAYKDGSLQSSRFVSKFVRLVVMESNKHDSDLGGDAKGVSVAVSGVSARFPSEEAQRFFHHDVFQHQGDVPENVQHSGLDADFFGLPKADQLDSLLLTVVKVVYETLADAGLSRETVSGSKIALHCEYRLGTDREHSKAEAEQMLSPLLEQVASVFKFEGVQKLYPTDTYGGLQVLHEAVNSILKQESESALVLTIDGEKTDTSNRRPTVCALLLQKQEQCKRIHVCPISITPSSSLKCLTETVGRSKGDISYAEIHQAEHNTDISSLISAIDRKENPVPITLMDNGKGDPITLPGLLDVVRLILWAEHGTLWQHTDTSTNLTPKDLPSGVTLVDKPIPWTPGLTCLWYINSSGAITNLVLKFPLAIYKDSNESKTVETQFHAIKQEPRIFLYGATSESSLTRFFDGSKIIDEDIAFHYLMQQSALESMPIRGYKILNTVDPKFNVEPLENQVKRPIWFVLPGVGASWHGMGRDMMKFSMFKESILKCSKVLEKLDPGVTLYDKIMHGEEKLWENVRHSSSGITAIQLALIDMLYAMGIKPDGTFGHSLGENPCAYVDGCATMEEIMGAMHAMASTTTSLKRPQAKLAAAAMTWEECKAACPEGVYAACHNGEHSVTVVGHIPRVNKFISQMKAKGIRATGICMSVFPHCPVAKEVAAESKLEEHARQCLVRRPRSSKWISTCYPEERWGEEEAKHYGPEYFMHNYLNPVLFHEAVLKIPKNAIVIEIGPMPLFRNIVRKTLGDGILYLSLMEKGEKNAQVFLSVLGTLYANNVNFDPLKLYPDIQLPNGSLSPMLSPHISKMWNEP